MVLSVVKLALGTDSLVSLVSLSLTHPCIQTSDYPNILGSKDPRIQGSKDPSKLERKYFFREYIDQLMQGSNNPDDVRKETWVFFDLLYILT